MSLHDTEFAKNLIVGPGALLLITGEGALTLTNGLDDFGVVQVGGGDPPMLTVNGPVTIEQFALLEAFGEGTQIQLVNTTLSNLGIIEAGELATITIGLKGGGSSNFGTIDAFDAGLITLNANGNPFANHGLIEASNGGSLAIVGDVTNFDGANIEAIGPNAVVDLSNGTIVNQDGAHIEASHRGAITMESETVTNESGAKIEATHLGTITFDVGSVTNDGKIEANHFGSISFEGSVFVKNNSDGTIEATKYGSIILDGADGNDGASGENDGGTILAKDHGVIAFENIGFTNQDGGIIEAKDAGTIIIEGAEGGPGGPAILNDGGTIEAIGLGSTVQIIQNATVQGGSFDVEGGALFVDGTSTLAGSVNVTIGHGGFADFASTVNANGADVSVAFAGMGKLELDQQPATPITVTGFGIGDAFDLTNVPLGNVTFSSSDNSLTIGESGSPALTLEGDYSESDFTLVTDAFGGTEVFFGNDVWTNTAGGDWTQTDSSNWSNGVPNTSKDVVIGLSGVYTVTIVPVGNDESREVHAGSLAITDAGATLTGSGTLKVTTTLDNAGIIQPDGFLTIDVGGADNPGTFINEYSGRVQSLDGNSLTINQESENGSSTNYGLIKAANGGSLTINHDGAATVSNALDDRGVIDVDATGFDPTLVIYGPVRVENDAEINAGNDAFVSFVNDQVGNAGTISANSQGSVLFEGSAVDNQAGGVIEANGVFSTVTFDNATVDNQIQFPATTIRSASRCW